MLPPDDPGRMGPYWRRQQHNTLPGERTAAELALVNAQRARLGLPPLGGPTQRTAVAVGAPARPTVLDLLRHAIAAPHPAGALLALPGMPMQRPVAGGLPVQPGPMIPRPDLPAHPAAAILLARLLAHTQRGARRRATPAY